MFKRKYEQNLIAWKNSSNRKPLIVRGARQVGKTLLVRKFGQENFNNYIEINLEKIDNQELFKGQFSIEEFEDKLQIIGAKLIPGETLLFVDEVQNNINFIRLLRFFYEERPDIHVIVAGSLLEPRIKREGISMPVGRVEFLYVYPLDFFEFLEVIGEGNIARYLKSHRFDQEIEIYVHRKSLDLFKKYIIIGGMPEAVKLFVREDDLYTSQKLYSDLLTTYIDDVYKYAEPNEIDEIIEIIKAAPEYSGSEVSYSNFAKLGYRSQMVSKIFRILEDIMLLKLVPNTSSTAIPLKKKILRQKKLVFLDVGFYSNAYDLTLDLSFDDLADYYRGSAMEQAVIQNIMAQNIREQEEIYFWAKDYTKGSASLDLCFFNNKKITGIEIKAGEGKRSRSVPIFLEDVENSRVIKFSSKNITKESDSNVLNLPFYMSPRVYEVDF